MPPYPKPYLRRRQKAFIAMHEEMSKLYETMAKLLWKQAQHRDDDEEIRAELLEEQMQLQDVIDAKQKEMDLIREKLPKQQWLEICEYITSRTPFRTRHSQEKE